MEECKGCLNLGSNGWCSSRLDCISESNQCPCLNCIVKMVCENECDIFVEFLEANGKKGKK